jgi:3-deoxy-manno-octulosonate cytidylyltransferase (CMP-KDO synthetase)
VKPIVIIPARYGSSRLPAKPLLEIGGKPLIQWTVESVRRHPGLGEIFVATDDERIAELVRACGGEAVMTGECATGTDRLAEAAAILGLGEEVVVNVQGDWPRIDPETIDGALAALEGNDMGTAATPLMEAQRGDRAAVKCARDQQGRALYFSRAPIGDLLHLGIYTYRASFLRRYAELESTPHQKAEQLEQLKALEHGHSIGVAIVDTHPLSVDTPDDIERAEKVLCQQSTSLSPAGSSPH